LSGGRDTWENKIQTVAQVFFDTARTARRQSNPRFAKKMFDEARHLASASLLKPTASANSIAMIFEPN